MSFIGYSFALTVGAKSPVPVVITLVNTAAPSLALDGSTVTITQGEYSGAVGTIERSFNLYRDGVFFLTTTSLTFSTGPDDEGADITVRERAQDDNAPVFTFSAPLSIPLPPFNWSRSIAADPADPTKGTITFNPNRDIDDLRVKVTRFGELRANSQEEQLFTVNGPFAKNTDHVADVSGLAPGVDEYRIFIDALEGGSVVQASSLSLVTGPATDTVPTIYLPAPSSAPSAMENVNGPLDKLVLGAPVMNVTNFTGANNPTYYWIAPDGTIFFKHFDFKEKGAADEFGQHILRTNGEDQVYVHPDWTGAGTTPVGLQPFSVSGTDLVITADNVPTANQAALTYTFSDDDDPETTITKQFPFYSGILNTRQSLGLSSGYFETEMQIPDEEGTWAAAWAYAQQKGLITELDPIETRGAFAEIPRYDATVHYNDGSVNKDSNTWNFSNRTGFNKYGVYWDTNQVVFYRNSAPTLQVEAKGGVGTDAMSFLVNLAINGVFTAGYTQATPADMPMAMTVRSLRAWAVAGSVVTRKSIAAATAPTAANISAVGETTLDIDAGTFPAGTNITTDRIDWAIVPVSEYTASTQNEWEWTGAFIETATAENEILSFTGIDTTSAYKLVSRGRHQASGLPGPWSPALDIPARSVFPTGLNPLDYIIPSG